MRRGTRSAVRRMGGAVMALVCAAVLAAALLGGTYVAGSALANALSSATDPPG